MSHIKSQLLPVLPLAACAHRPGIPLHVAHCMTTVHDADFTPLQALQSATWRNAGCPRDAGDPVDIARGTVAGIMLFDRNPLGHISATRAIHTVVHRADYLDRGAWDAMLAPVRARVAARETEAH